MLVKIKELTYYLLPQRAPVQGLSKSMPNYSTKHKHSINGVQWSKMNKPMGFKYWEQLLLAKDRAHNGKQA
jgi:hypothetical protein